MDEKIERIKLWLGTGSINIFGLPFSGKDTVGVRLAETLGARFLSSGMILRSAQENDSDLKHEMNSGELANTDKFRDIVIPYFFRDDLKESALILSSVGRWAGEEEPIINASLDSNHPIRAAILLNISEAEVYNRWEAARAEDTNGGRGLREDDRNPEVIKKRLEEFNQKTMPVINTYRLLGLLLPVYAHDTKDAVFENVINALYSKSIENTRNVSFTQAQ